MIMSTKGTNRSSARPEEFSESHGHVRNVAVEEEAPRPLRSVEEILEARLERRETREELEEEGEGRMVRAERGGIPDEDFPVEPVDEGEVQEGMIEERK
jgi:hypothetical protein